MINSGPYPGGEARLSRCLVLVLVLHGLFLEFLPKNKIVAIC
jgi:hypothetical protein